MADEQQMTATSDVMLQMLRQLQAVETEKRAFPIGSEEFVIRAVEAERLSRIIFRWSGIQQQMADESVATVEQGSTRPVPMDTVQVRPLDRILAEWRQAQVRLEAAPPGSSDADEAAVDVDRLRVAYQETLEARHSDSTDGASPVQRPD